MSVEERSRRSPSLSPSSVRSDNSVCAFSPYSEEVWNPPTQKENGFLLRSPASRGYPAECTDFGRFSTQIDNKSVRVRSAHLQWLRENDLYLLHNMDRWRTDVRAYRPGSSARYPVRNPISKQSRDPEWLAQDFKVHIYHGRSEGAWVRDWLRGILEVRRFEVTASSLTSPCGSDIKKIIIVATEKMLKKGYDPTSLRSADGKLVLIIKLSECSIPEDIEDICTAHLDLSTLGTHDQTLQTPLMFKVYKALKLPMSICSA